MLLETHYLNGMFRNKFKVKHISLEFDFKEKRGTNGTTWFPQTMMFG